MGRSERAIRRGGVRAAAWAIVLAGVALPSPAMARADFESHLDVGVETRTIDTHFYDGAFGAAPNTWETFKMTGVRVEGRWGIETDFGLIADGGVGGVFLTGTYDYEVGGSTGSGDATGAELDLSGELGYAVIPQLVLFGRAGFGYTFLFADAITGAAPPYNEAFNEYLFDLYLGLGLTYRIGDHVQASVLYRRTAAGLDGYTDYRVDPTFEDVTNSGFMGRVGWRF